ncbi:type II toxin-antitoxin system antitoxin SocA domain-containing protein [Aliarcobacter skirrowii]|uniref:type II toxin-antitoxin system antitoxin SocA domain-containing protein n=1 Tax=Aliarcobacter skirrowii TaxID=28200 RepID=UPI0008324BF4|nr:type II toxin-antitoxin system antitoxin SocA domain-containing protein [Aliarcobacter skirrowii]
MVDMTKVANIILYMLHKHVKGLNNKKVELMLFFMEKNHLDFFNQKIVNEEFIKDKRGVKAKNLSEIFELIIDEVDLDEDDERVYFIQELLDFLEIDIVEKNGYKELNFSKFEEDFSEELFSKDEFKTIHKVVSLYKDTTVRNLANESFSIDKVRSAELGDLIL